MIRTLTAGVTAAIAVALLTACGAPGSSAQPDAAAPAQTGTAATGPLPTSPGSITIGSADFPESELLARIYAGAMTAKGVKVTVHSDIGERPAYMQALADGSIGAIPEYSGAILSYLDTATKATSPTDVYAQLRTVAAAKNLAVTDYAQAQDVDTITVTGATAARYHLSSIGDLRNVAGRLTFGAPAPLETDPYGVPGLKRVYGVAFSRFVTLSASGSVTQTALRNGTVDAADIFSTDPSIQQNGFVSLKDPQHLFAAQNVVPLFRRDALTQPMADAVNAVSAHLDTATLAGLVAQLAGGTDPTGVAAHWLTTQHLG